MNWHHIDLFLERPLYQSLILLISCFCLVFIGADYFFIQPQKEFINTQIYENQSINNEIEHLKIKLIGYPDLESLKEELENNHLKLQSQYLLNDQIISIIKQLILDNKLDINDLSINKTPEDLQIYLKLKGEYSNFINFISELSNPQFCLKLSNLKIHKQQNDLIYELAMDVPLNMEQFDVAN
ncbi:hypothetical protein RCS94_08070 [Orbaceae bacterium ac157xtp]